MKLIEALKEKPVKIESKYMGESTEGKWKRDDWTVFLEYEGRKQSFEYHTGIGLRQFPKPKAGWHPRHEEGGEHLLNLEEYKNRLAGKQFLFPDTGVNAKLNKIFAKPVPPPVADVLSCLLLDFSAINSLFEEWCAEYGYDTDSRKAEKLYNQCRENAIKVMRLLGADFYFFLDNSEH